MMLTLLSGGHGPSFTIEGFYLIDFIVYVGLLVYFLRKPISQFLTARRERITADMAEAQRMREEAEAKLKDYSQRLDNLDAEIQQILDDARQAGESARKKIMADADRAARQIREEAKARLQQETRKLEHDLRRRTVELAVTAAEQAITQQITDTHRRRFVSDYISDLEARQGEL